jgi:hypothetical protein
MNQVFSPENYDSLNSNMKKPGSPERLPGFSKNRE